MSDIIQKCFVCGKLAEELEEYVDAAAANEMPIDQFVAEEEGTYNPESGNFACTECYIAIGMPSRDAPDRWRAP